MDKFISNPYIIFLLYFLVTSAFSYLIYSIVLRFASTLGIRETNDQPSRWASTQKPALGGICFYIIFLFSIAFYPFFFREEAFYFSREFIGFVAAATLAFLMGLADDAYDTKPFLKLVVQILCGVILVSSGTSIELFNNEYLDTSLTIIWVVGIMNSINMLDNMDAITTLVAICILLYIIFSRFILGEQTGIYVFMLIGLTAALIVFLYFNWYPSRMFMGDTGSQLLGLVLAAGGISSCWESGDMEGEMMVSKQLLSVLLVFIIPITDTATVVINRMLRGRSPFVGGRDHTTHALFFRGVTERRIAVLFTGLSLAGAGSSLLILSIPVWSFLYFAIFLSYFLVVFLTLFFLNRITIR